MKKILTKQEVITAVATGIELEDGSVHPADVVISAADGHSTIFDMLEGKFVDDKIRKDYQELEVFSSPFFVPV
ncbi:MAG: hypothetical protein ACLFPE_07550 [Bacteroidales bacterium]